MKIDWNTVLNVVIALALFEILDRLVLNKVWDKIGGYEVIAADE